MFHKLFILLLSFIVVVVQSQYDKLDIMKRSGGESTVPTAEIVSPLNTVQVDVDAIEKLVADKVATERIKKMDELHKTAKQQQYELHELTMKMEKEKTADESKRIRAEWAIHHPQAAKYEYEQERRILQDETNRKIQLEESTKRMKILVDEQAARDYVTTFAARTQANKHFVAGVGYVLIGCGVGFLVLQSSM